MVKTVPISSTVLPYRDLTPVPGQSEADTVGSPEVTKSCPKQSISALPQALAPWWAACLSSKLLTADTIPRVPRPGAKGQEAEKWIPTLKGLSEEGCLTRVLKITQECAGRQSGSGQVSTEAPELPGIREGHNILEA